MIRGIDTFIFDMYGTLVDIYTDEDKPELWEQMAMHYGEAGAEYTADELKSEYHRLVEAEIALTQFATHYDISDDCVEPQLRNVFVRLYRQKGVQANFKEIDETGWLFREISTERLGLYDGAPELLSKLNESERSAFLLTNAQDIFTMPELRLLGICDAFDGILISSEAGVRKPAVQFFEMLIDKYRIDISSAIMVGNDAVCDIMPAHELGMRSVYIHTEQSPERPDKLPADCTEIKSLEELLTLYE